MTQGGGKDHLLFLTMEILIFWVKILTTVLLLAKDPISLSVAMKRWDQHNTRTDGRVLGPDPSQRVWIRTLGCYTVRPRADKQWRRKMKKF